MADTTNLTQERAAARFHQMVSLERQLASTIEDIVECKRSLKDLQEEEAALVKRLRKAARDEGELPLFEE
jgi:regulator of replication initiation timing